MKKKYMIATVFLLVAFSLICISIMLYHVYYDRYVSNFKDKISLYIYPDMSKELLLEQIKSSGNLKSYSSLKRAFKDLDSLKKGHYIINETMSSEAAVRVLEHAWQEPVNIVISRHLRRASDIAKNLSKQLLLDSVTVMQALGDSTLFAGYGLSHKDYFSLIFPDTYNVYWTASIKDILDLQKKEYDKFWTEDNLRKAKNLSLTPQQVAVLASIVKGESNYVPEYPRIASVYLNRLRKGMKLGADPTIAYIYDYKLNRILNKHTRTDSPYNTYMYRGLPPHPICVPTKDCLEAVLNPANEKYLFFCASYKLDGTHIFARTYREHKANARKFYKAIKDRANKSN